MGEKVVNKLPESDIRLCFIRQVFDSEIPFVHRLDGISFNSSDNYIKGNFKISKSYKNAKAVICQSNFDKKIIKNFFGERDNLFVINNGTSLEKIEKISPSDSYSNFSKVWSCASMWKNRPHKRLMQNIEYFLKNSKEDECLVVMGEVDEKLDDSRIIYLGQVKWKDMISVMKISGKFIHLALVDHCPNVVVDARACGCQIICNSISGTKEIAGKDAIIIDDDFSWDLKTPFDYRKKVEMSFAKKTTGCKDANLDIRYVAKEYVKVMKEAYEVAKDV
jgi:glycosyltransferase involved in cell wall biosynthesis